MKTRYISVLIVLLAVTSDRVPAQNPKAVAQKAFPSVVLLAMNDKNGQPLAFGSGFFIGRDVVATNFHVVEGAASGFAKLVGRDTKYQVSSVVGKDEDTDLALLKVSGPSAPPLAFGDSEMVEVGDPIYVIGNPHGLEGTFSEGLVSGVRKVGVHKVFQITAPISPGSSGGPVLNLEGKVIGVAVASFRGGQNLNFAIPVGYLGDLVRQARLVSPTPLQSATSRNTPSLVGNLGSQGTDGVTVKYFQWERGSLSKFTYTVQNQLQSTVRGIEVLILFVAADGGIVHAEKLRCPYWGEFGMGISTKGELGPGLGHRCSGVVDESVSYLAKDIQFRTLSFVIVK